MFSQMTHEGVEAITHLRGLVIHTTQNDNFLMEGAYGRIHQPRQF